MKKWFVVSLVGGSLLVAALACGGPAPAPTAAPLPQAPAPQAAPPQAQPAVGGEVGAVDVVNDSSASIVCYLYVSPANSQEWGTDRLGADTTVGPGQTFSVTDVPVGTYDFRAEDCSNNPIDEEYGVQVTSAGVTWTFSDTGGAAPAGGAGTVQVVNNTTASTVCFLYVSPASSQEWGDDQLGSDTTVPPGQTFDLTDIPAGSYDLRASDCDNNVIDEEYGVQVSQQVVTWTFTDN